MQNNFLPVKTHQKDYHIFDHCYRGSRKWLHAPNHAPFTYHLIPAHFMTLNNNQNKISYWHMGPGLMPKTGTYDTPNYEAYLYLHKKNT